MMTLNELTIENRPDYIKDAILVRRMGTLVEGPMRRITLTCLFLFTALSLPLAQRTPNTEPTVPAGTRIRVKLNSALRTNVARPGDAVEATLVKRVESNGVVVLPAGTIIRGMVDAARSANQNNKIEPSLLVTFHQISLPDGRILHASASIADVGRKKHVDSSGLVTRPELTERKKLGAIVLFSAAGAGIGAPYEAKGAGIGAAAGAGYGGLALLLGNRQYSDFELRKGRKLWLRLNHELISSAHEQITK